MKTISRMFLIVALAVGLTTGLFANGLNMNGFGARAAAMGGAFVGLANDYYRHLLEPGRPGPADEGVLRPQRGLPHPDRPTTP